MKNTGKKIMILCLLCIFTLLNTNIASAHFNFFLPEEWNMKQAKENEVEIIWGHPFEGIYFDHPEMEKLGMVKPDGTNVSLSYEEINVEGAEGSAKALQTSFTPDIKGDYILYADFKPLVVEEEDVAWEDHVKAVIHHKTFEGWDQSTGQIIEIMPLTRPYGLEEGFIFSGQVLYEGKPLAGAPVEIERYHKVGVCTDENLPEESLVTRETKTDPNGIFSFTLDEPGVWVICAANTVGTVQGYDRDVRGILMINIEEETSLLSSETEGATQGKESQEDDDDEFEQEALPWIAFVLSLVSLFMCIFILVKVNKMSKKD